MTQVLLGLDLRDSLRKKILKALIEASLKIFALKVALFEITQRNFGLQLGALSYN